MLRLAASVAPVLRLHGTAQICSAVLLIACGGPGSAAEEPERSATTSGGEAEVERAERPIRTTTPIPVPQPAIAREELSEPLQQVWTEVEEAVAIRPPEGPAVATEEAVQAWADGPFREWIGQRGDAMQSAVASSEAVPDEPPHERAMASALLGYAFEDFVADVWGSPLPADLAQDAELLEIYVTNLMEVLRPMAVEAVISYGYCQQRLAALGDESEWLPWRAYCVQRGREVIETYELTASELSPAAEGESSEGEGDEEGDLQEDEAEVEPTS